MKRKLNSNEYTDIISNRVKFLKSRFPMLYTPSNNILNLINISVFIDDGLKHPIQYMLDIIDDEKYKYHKEYSTLINGIHKNYIQNKFFYGNKYTYDNINNFIKINNLDLKLLTVDLEKLNARSVLLFTNSNNEEIYMSWNAVQSNPDRFKPDYETKKQINKELRMCSKEKAVNIILNKYKELNRPLVASDFRGKTSENNINIRVIYRIWGSFTNMLNELGLPTLKDIDLYKHVKYMNEIKLLCEKVYNEKHRKLIAYSDFNDEICNTTGIHCKLDGTTLSQYIKSLGFELQKPGNGLNYTFDDSEKVVSTHEYGFSNYLRSIGLKYNKDYFRDVRYDKISTKYKGNMNCDYEIHFQGRIFYVELAGLLCHPCYERCYKENKHIETSKSKEKYRLKLMTKKSIFEEESLEYYIILPSEMNEENYREILGYK